MKKNETNVLIVRPKTATAKETAKQTAPEQTAMSAEPKQTEIATPAGLASTASATATPPVPPAKLSDGTPTNPVEMQTDELKKARERIAELENQLRKEPQTIEERIAYYKRKQELTERYERYNAQVAHLEELRAQVEDTNELADDFSDSRDFYKLQLFMPGYSKDAAVSITNQSLIDAVLNMLKGKMLDKAAELKAEISA